VLNCPSYQSRYCDFLKIDFPRIRLVRHKEQFVELASLGARLIRAHLLCTPGPAPTAVSFPVTGNNAIDKNAPQYAEIDPATGEFLEQNRVYINASQYFENVPQEIWEAEIGGYQVCHQWIKGRRGRTLSYADLAHYQRMVAGVYEALQVVDEIDSIAPNWSAT
jgi:hypothetical protein